MSVRLRVNPIACEAHGMCAELLPEWIGLDDWGYPIVAGEPVPPELVEHRHDRGQRQSRHVLAEHHISETAGEVGDRAIAWGCGRRRAPSGFTCKSRPRKSAPCW